MRNWLFTPFNDLEDRPIDVISFFVLFPALVYVTYILLEIYG
jgi:hypothetical protein